MRRFVFLAVTALILGVGGIAVAALSGGVTTQPGFFRVCNFGDGACPTGATATADGDILVEDALEVDGAADLDGALDVAGALTGTTGAFSSTLTVVSQTVGLDFSTFRIFDAISTPLTIAAGDDDDLTYYAGTFGTDAAAIQSVDCGGLNDTTQKAVFTVVMPQTYLAGSTVSLVSNVGMNRVADQAATMDFSCYVADYANADQTMSGDLITPAAQSVNSATYADITFVIDDDATGYDLAAGDVVECLLTVLCDDDGNAGNDIEVVINRMDLVIST